MKVYAVFGLVALIILAGLGAACGDDDGAGSGDQETSGEGANGADELAGAIVPDTFLTYDGQQFELKEILQADFVDEAEFAEAGQATEIDVDGDPTVYTREGDDSSVYTFFEGAGAGEVATPDSWYRWAPAN